MTKIIIVDTPRWIDTIQDSLDNSPYKVVLKVTNFKLSFDQIVNSSADVIILDYNIIRSEAIDCIGQLRKEAPALKILLTNNSGIDTWPLIQAGVSGFILKNNFSQEILPAVRSLKNGDFFFSPQITTSLLKKFLQNGSYIKDSKLIELKISERENEILQLVLREKSNIEIAENLNISRRTVEAHKRNLIIKSNSKNLVGLILYSVKNQLVDL